MRRSGIALGLMAALFLPAAQGQGQQSPRPRGALLATRAALEQRAAALDSAGAGRAGGAAAAELAALRRRLTEGDFQVGDRVFLAVEGEETLSDTFTVTPERQLILPAVGVVSLRGVLRSELETALTAEIARYVRSPAVRASALVIVSVTGDVATPGFYPMPVTALVADVVMAAGGGTRDARLKDLRVERAGETLWNADFVTRAIRDGRTLDELGLRSGDQFFVPGRNRGGTESNLRVAALILSIPVTIYTLTRIF